jgi:hypothetical protein
MGLNAVESNAPQVHLWDPEARSNEYLKKNPKVDPAHAMHFSSSISSMAPEIKPIEKQTAIAAVNPPKKGFFTEIKEWFEDKWDKFLVFLGIRNPYKPPVRDQTQRSKILERSSPYEIEEDFKYIDVSQSDPLKVMVQILVQQGRLRQDEAFLLTQKILLAQQDLKDIHDQRAAYFAEIAVVNKRTGVTDKINVGLSAAQVVGFIATGIGFIVQAANVVTGGAAAPVEIVVGVLNGIVSGASAMNGWAQRANKQSMDEIQSKFIGKNADRDKIQLNIKISSAAIKDALTAVTAHAEVAQSLIAAQLGKN